MYFLNMLFSKPQLFFLYFFCNWALFLPFLYVLEHANRQQYCYIGIFLCFLLGVFSNSVG